MARVVVGSYVVQFPLGGYLSWVLQWLIGFQRLGHDVWLVEKAEGEHACFDPIRGVMSDDGSHGMRVVHALLEPFGLQARWAFVDHAGRLHGMTAAALDETWRSCDLFVDMGSHGLWMDEAQRAAVRILVDGEPGATQMRMVAAEAAGRALPRYDRYYTVGLNVGSPGCTVPTAGRTWHPIVDPVVLDLFPNREGDPTGPFTTIMSWQAYQPFTFEGRVFGQKDMEFEKFRDLPSRPGVGRLELAVGGRVVPEADLRAAGWLVRSAHATTLSFAAFREYIAGSAGEFGVCKHVFVDTASGWFSDRSAAYLASGRPVVLQETAFGRHLPCGEGLFAVRSAEEAAEAIRTVRGDYARQSRAARALAASHFSSDTVLRRLTGDIGI